MATITLIQNPPFILDFQLMKKPAPTFHTLCEKVQHVALPRIVAYAKLLTVSFAHGFSTSLLFMVVPLIFAINFCGISSLKFWATAYVVISILPGLKR